MAEEWPEMSEERGETTEDCLVVGEELASLSSLPTEMVHHISQFLTGPDILNLILTCRRLRTVLNDDFFWRGRVPTHPDIDAVRSIEPRVGAAIEVDERSPPICDSLMSYLLSENWRLLNVKVSPSIPSPDYSSFEHPRFRRKRDSNSNLFHKNRYVALCHLSWATKSSEANISVYDTDDTPKLVASLQLEEIQSGVQWDGCYQAYSFGIHVAGGYLVVALHSKAFLYQIDTENSKLSLKSIILIMEDCVNRTEDEVITDHQAGKETRSDLPTFWQHAFSGDLMISADGLEPVLHVWNIVEAKKIGKFESPLPWVRLPSFHSVCQHLCIFEDNTSGQKVFLIFDLNKKTFLRPFSREQEGHREEHVIFHDDIVIFFKEEYHGEYFFQHNVHCQCYVWPLNAVMSEGWNVDKAVANRRFASDDSSMGKFRQFYRLTVIDGKFPHYHDGLLQVVDARTLETVVRINVRDYDSSIPPLEVFGSSFIFRCTQIHDFRIKYSIWNLKDNNGTEFIVDRQKDSFLSNVYVNPSDTKAILCFSKSLRVMHFW